MMKKGKRQKCGAKFSFHTLSLVFQEAMAFKKIFKQGGRKGTGQVKTLIGINCLQFPKLIEQYL